MLEPRTIQKIGATLAIAWQDGREDYLDLAGLRRACPCAVCQGEADAFGGRSGGEHRPAPGTPPDLLGWQIVGGYGFQPRWADGHATGIFTFAMLRALGDSQ